MKEKTSKIQKNGKDPGRSITYKILFFQKNLLKDDRVATKSRFKTPGGARKVDRLGHKHLLSRKNR